MKTQLTAGLLTPEGPAVDAEEEAFIRAMKRKKRRSARAWVCNQSINN